MHERTISKKQELREFIEHTMHYENKQKTSSFAIVFNDIDDKEERDKSTLILYNFSLLPVNKILIWAGFPLMNLGWVSIRYSSENHNSHSRMDHQIFLFFFSFDNTQQNREVMYRSLKHIGTEIW